MQQVQYKKETEKGRKEGREGGREGGKGKTDRYKFFSAFLRLGFGKTRFGVMLPWVQITGGPLTSISKLGQETFPLILLISNTW